MSHPSNRLLRGPGRRNSSPTQVLGNFAWDGFLLETPRGRQELGSGSGQRPKAGGRGSCSGTPQTHSSWGTPAIGTPKKETRIGKSLGVVRAQGTDGDPGTRTSRGKQTQSGWGWCRGKKEKARRERKDREPLWPGKWGAGGKVEDPVGSPGARAIGAKNRAQEVEQGVSGLSWHGSCVGVGTP